MLARPTSTSVLFYLIGLLFVERSLMHDFSGATHLNADNVHEEWLSDDQASDFNAGVNGPIDRNEVGPHSHSLCAG